MEERRHNIFCLLCEDYPCVIQMLISMPSYSPEPKPKSSKNQYQDIKVLYKISQAPFPGVRCLPTLPGQE